MLRFVTGAGHWYRHDSRPAVVESLCWALLTPVIFGMAARFGSERGGLGAQPALFAAVGIAVAAILSLGGDAMREVFHRPPPGPRRPRPPGPPVWFGFVNALVVYLGALAAGLARAYSLRYRARREQAVQRSSPKRTSPRFGDRSIRTCSSTR